MELQMQYTYKGACISMISDSRNYRKKTVKEWVVSFHKESINWATLDYSNSIWYTSGQAIKQFRKMVHELNKGNTHINIEKYGLHKRR